MCYTVSCRNYLQIKYFKNCETISTDGEVMSKIKVAFFSGTRCILSHSLFCGFGVILNLKQSCSLSLFDMLEVVSLGHLPPHIGTA